MTENVSKKENTDKLTLIIKSILRVLSIWGVFRRKKSNQ